MKQDRREITMANRASEWVVTLAVWLGVFVLMLEYHRWRGKDYFENIVVFVFVANKAVGISSFASLCLALALGPLHRLTCRWRAAVRLRRPFGLIGAAGVSMHVIVSLFWVERFDLAFYVDRWPAIAVGTLGAGLLGVMVVSSYPRELRRLGRARWQRVHGWGWTLIPISVLHAIVLTGKIWNWPVWLERRAQPVPPGSLVVFVIAVTALVVIGVESVRRSRGATPGPES